jgi:hypothetical protein
MSFRPLLGGAKQAARMRGLKRGIVEGRLLTPFPLHAAAELGRRLP